MKQSPTLSVEARAALAAKLESIKAARLAREAALAEQELEEAEPEYRQYYPKIEPWNVQLFTALWKWRLAHPYNLNWVEFNTLLSKLSGEPVLATFERADTVKFLSLYNLASMQELNKLHHILNSMELTVPAYLHPELYDYLAEVNKQPSNKANEGG